MRHLCRQLWINIVDYRFVQGQKHCSELICQWWATYFRLKQPVALSFELPKTYQTQTLFSLEVNYYYFFKYNFMQHTGKFALIITIKSGAKRASRMAFRHYNTSMTAASFSWPSNILSICLHTLWRAVPKFYSWLGWQLTTTVEEIVALHNVSYKIKGSICLNEIPYIMYIAQVQASSQYILMSLRRWKTIIK